ncbi:MAG: hypothetical protein KKG14_10985 [Alphaproteobacteria bacterium]|nr:hypothetical protein [Alphaproteobacteria bacterium]MBU2272510.1 hypothetical protein [Alphaproteobacteria bacterium]MBU2419216.1 hypothetical protein [Alphaproteobacteria bacterium]
MEEVHRTHKEPAWGWVAVLNDWRRSRARARLRQPNMDRDVAPPLIRPTGAAR